MKYYLIAACLLLALLAPKSVSAQVVDEVFGGRFTTTSSVDLGSDKFLISGVFKHARNRWKADSVQVGDFIIDCDCNTFTVDSIYSVLDNSIHMRVNDESGTATKVKLCTGGIVRSQEGYIRFPNDLPTPIIDCIINYNYTVASDPFTDVYAEGDTLFFITISGDTVYTITGSDAFDSDRPILRVPDEGTTIGGATVGEWLEWWYFTPPTISISSMSSPVEVGTSNTYNVSGTTTNTGGATLSNGLFRQTSPSTVVLVSFTSATSYADTILFTPQQGGSGQFNELTYTFQACQDWVFGAESGTATSTARTVTGVYPVLYGMSATDFTSTGNPYTGLTKLVQAEGNKTVTLTGSGYIYFLVPKTWGDYTLSQILDHNGFNVTASFSASDISISSSSLTNNWSTVAYRMYKLNTTTITSGYAYQFIR